MRILSIEPTPSPNTMKIILDETLPGGKSNNYTKTTMESAPENIKRLLEIEGVKGVYHVADFLALERNPKVDWKVILPQVRAVFGESGVQVGQVSQQNTDEGFGEVKVFIQKFKGIPMQVKLTDGDEERRFGLSDRFREAVLAVEKTSSNVVIERKWEETGVRYGDLEEIGELVVDELSASYDDNRLQELIDKALQKESAVPRREERFHKVTVDMLNNDDWKKRYAALEKLDPSLEDLPVLEKALADEKASIRRLAVVYLGMIEDEKVLPFLYEAVLHDPSVTVRRTAGDCLSDFGSEKAIPTMIKALKDKNKLVRWRAAMFLYEVGDKSAIKPLKEAQNDPEFEVAMQIKMALKRIEGGIEAEGSVWKQMTDSIQNRENK
jgi:hypothetical protein